MTQKSKSPQATLKIKNKIKAGLLLLQIGVFATYMFTTSCAPQKAATLTTTPDTATVFIAKQTQPIGKTPLKYNFNFGNSKQFDLVVKKPHYDDGHITITAEPKDQLMYHLDLHKSDTTSVELVTFETVAASNGTVTLAMKTTTRKAFLNYSEESPNVKSCTQRTNNLDPTYFIGGPIISPDNQSLLYSIFVKDTNIKNLFRGYSTIFKQPLTSFGRQTITIKSNNILDLFPCFSSDGSAIYFSSNRNKSYPTIRRINTSSAGGITSLTNSDAQEIDPAVSPAGDLIYYSALSPNTEAPIIWSIKQNGTLATQLKEGECPAITPDAKRIVFLREKKDAWVKRDTFKTHWVHPKQVWIMDANGENETELTFNTDFDIKDPAVSPDGKYIVFASDEALDKNSLHNYDIWIMPINATTPTQLTTNGSYDDAPTWSPDGKKIYFRSNRGGYWNIWCFEPDLSSLNR